MRGWVIVLSVAVPVEAAATLALPGAVGRAIDGGPALLLGAVLLVGALAGAFATLSGPAVAAGTTVELRQRLLRRVLTLGPNPDGPATGDLTARLVGSAADAGGALPSRITAATALLTSLGAVLGLALLSPWLAAAFFAGVLPGVVLIRLFLRDAAQAFTRYQQVQSELAARLTGALAGLRSIHAAGARETETARVLAPLPRLAEAGHALWQTQRRTVWQATLLVALVELSVLTTAGLQLSNGTLRPGELAAAAGWAALGLGFFEQVEALAGVAHARAGRERVAELLALPAPPPGFRDLPDGPGELTLIGVSVAGLLGPLDLTVPGGRTVALVGRSGSGKSLLAAVAGGLRTPDSGLVLIDGVPIAELAPGQRRSAVGYAFERPALVGATVGEALEGAGPAETRAARADGFLARLPRGDATPTAELRLSGGELQRLGLARLLAQRPRVMILDDATSSLDLATEHQVTEALTLATAGRTRLLVAHRPGAAARADLVAWLDGGRLRALAPHTTLVKDPDYRATLACLSTVPAPRSAS
ncbi:ATP-binding cassette subfamily B protein [Kitasatospora gansuensis]|uniref:ATP-binding cassette subfamily B protein n=1 Tax=Kitasatospora gansuensis TaxID=258050 RepID=A0A7W7SFZ1_9ACTN|nr:ABC transporter ATP-binding protein [Kitasatospora gansuensis]MBB4949775.1 ATP-binding cassette subfamily B protein [Kitasatospora gansuensis]